MATRRYKVYMVGDPPAAEGYLPVDAEDVELNTPDDEGKGEPFFNFLNDGISVAWIAAKHVKIIVSV